MLPIFVLPARDVLIGVGLMVLMGCSPGVMPAMAAMRLRITDALRRESLTMARCDWTRTDASPSRGAEYPHDSRPAQLVGRGHRRHRGRRRGVRVGAVDRRRAFGGDAGLGLARSRAGDAQRRRQRDDQRPRRTGCRHHQAGAGHPAGRPDRRWRPRSCTSSSTCRRKSTPDAPANVPMRGIEPESMPLRKEFSIVEGRMFQFGTNEVIVGRGANGQFVDLNVGDTIVVGTEPLAGRRHIRSGRRRRRNRNLERRANAAGRISPRQHLSVGARAARFARVVRDFPRLAHVESTAERLDPPRERILRRRSRRR